MNLFLLGVYVGGVVVAWLELHLRRQEIGAVGWAGIVAWPLTVAVLAAMGVEKCRESIGLVTHEVHVAFMKHQREHLRIWDEQMTAREKAADEMARQANGVVSALSEGTGAIERSTYWLAMLHASEETEKRFAAYENELFTAACPNGCGEDEDCDCDADVDLDRLKELLVTDFVSRAEQRFPRSVTEEYVARHTVTGAGLSSVILGVHDEGCRDLGCAGCVDVSTPNPHIGSELDVEHLAETGEVREPPRKEPSKSGAEEP